MDTEKKLMSLINSVRVLTSTLDLDEVLHQLIKEVLNVIEGSNAGILFLYDKKTNKLYPKSTVGFDMQYMKHMKVSPGEGMTGITFLSQKGNIWPTKEDTEKAMANISPEVQELHFKALGVYEHPQSALCVPLISKDECIGVLIVNIYDKNVQFDEKDLRLLETFAVQATIAIENAMLFSRNERTKKIHEELSRVSLSQGGLKEINKALSELVNKKVAVYNDFYDLLVASSADAEQSAEEVVLQHRNIVQQAMSKKTITYEKIQLSDKTTGVYFFPIKADKYTIGLLTIFLEEDSVLDPLDRFAVEQASVIFALEMNRRESTAINDLKYSGYILNQLLHNQYNELSLKQLSKLNFFEDKDHRYISVKTHIKDPLLSFKELTERIHQLSRFIYREISNFQFKTLVLDKNMEIAFMFVVPRHINEAIIYEQLNELFTTLQERSMEGSQLLIITGMGRVVSTLKDVQLSYRDAQKCIDYLQSTNKKDTILSYHQLGTHRLFLKTERNELKEYVEDTLGSIISYDKKNDTELIQTLKVYLDTNQNMAQSAKKLYVHTNTIKYRLKTIQQILNIDSLDGRKAFDLQLGLYILEYLRV
jgi:sugar diacid utilization regulator